MVNFHVLLLGHFFTQAKIQDLDHAAAPVEIRKYLAYLKEYELAKVPAAAVAEEETK